jgi:SAM-dependent methyltransferase
MTALFDRIGRQFLTYYDSAQGAVRGEVVRTNLSSFLPKHPVNVLDVGCGEGLDALWLARQGYTVTAIDPSPTMLASARLAAKRLTRNERLKLRLLECDDNGAVGLLDAHSFDLVVCHGVIMYQDDDASFLANLSSLLAPGGILSLVARNADALAYRPATEGDYGEARRLIEQRSLSAGRLGAVTRAHSMHMLRRLLARNHLTTVEWFGVKVFSDPLTETIEQAALDELVALENTASRVDPYRRSARLLHIVARSET